ITKARKSKPKSYTPLVPHEAVDLCKESYDAANESKQKANAERYDDTGLMCLVCRHDIPIFLANIDTPGEQQKYAVALLQELFSNLPPQATVASLYDVGCVADRSLKMVQYGHQYDILPEQIVKRLRFATSIMHAYGHQWSCQLVYNPRLREGLGLTDGEGVERLWSRMRRLIGIERSQWRSRRLWLLDRQTTFIAEDLREDLGSWLVRRLRKGVQDQGNHAQAQLWTCGVSVEKLRLQWKDQVRAQTSLRARTFLFMVYVVYPHPHANSQTHLLG
ncbi:hypothetical protein BDN72DRAFT_782814, partial [Pluteus cervinus]